MSKEFQVATYDYDLELGTSVYVDYKEFDSRKEAMEYAKTIEHTISSRTLVKGDYGYEVIAKSSRRCPLTEKV